jgi:hypothetical protein
MHRLRAAALDLWAHRNPAPITISRVVARCLLPKLSSSEWRGMLRRSSQVFGRLAPPLQKQQARVYKEFEEQVAERFHAECCDLCRNLGCLSCRCVFLSAVNRYFPAVAYVAETPSRSRAGQWCRYGACYEL